MGRRPFLRALFWLVTGSIACADSWCLKPEVKDTDYVFGDTHLVLHYDSTANSKYPSYSLKIKNKEKLVAQHDGIGFQRVFASDDNKYFVGVSNSGLMKHAYVVFDRDGKILKAQPHDLREVKYHEMSVTLTRRWCDLKNPDVKFEIADGVLRDVTIMDCRGKRVALLSKPQDRKPKQSPTITSAGHRPTQPTEQTQDPVQAAGRPILAL